jgi:hypothetical protein
MSIVKVAGDRDHHRISAGMVILISVYSFYVLLIMPFTL